jgi:hypothetical protein
MQTPARSVVLEGLEPYRVVEPMFEGLRVILSYRGEPYSPAYVQGISGAAFRVSGICPCAPTCGTAMQPQDLAHLFGYQVESLPLQAEGLERENELAVVLARIKDELRQGRPVLLWHAFTNAEWDVVCGFDEDQQVFFGRGSYLGLDGYASAPETRTLTSLDICPALGAILVGEKVREFDASAAELAALREAVRHGRARRENAAPGGPWVFLEGNQCYNRWVSEFRDDPERRRTAGDSYCLNVMRSSHRAAAEFLRELASAYPMATSQLERAASCFLAEAETLDSCENLLGWSAPEGPDSRRNFYAADLLAHASDAYATGISSIEKALKRIDRELKYE